MAEKQYKPYVIPPEPNTWDNLLEKARGTKTFSITAQGFVESPSDQSMVTRLQENGFITI